MMKRILIIDNYDSFTYNIVQIMQRMGCEPTVKRNDEIDIDEVEQYDKIIVSPGPGIPSEAGILMPMLKRYSTTKPILGVCLGHQAIGESFGAQLENMSTVKHGVATDIEITGQDYIFDEMPTIFKGGRYHSWIVSERDFPSELIVTARDEDGQIMALRHAEYDVHGIQFHPESILTPEGARIIENFIKA